MKKRVRNGVEGNREPEVAKQPLSRSPRPLVFVRASLRGETVVVHSSPSLNHLRVEEKRAVSIRQRGWAEIIRKDLLQRRLVRRVTDLCDAAIPKSPC